MRGRFIRGDGLVLPNNISLSGSQMILEAAFRNTVPTFYVALVVGAPDADMTMANMQEPTIGLNGYARVSVARSALGWPVSDEVAGERIISTDWLTWIPTGNNFDKPIQRCALVSNVDGITSETPVYALSSPLPSETILHPTDPLSSRQFKYQIFL